LKETKKDNESERYITHGNTMSEIKYIVRNREQVIIRAENLLGLNAFASF